MNKQNILHKLSLYGQLFIKRNPDIFTLIDIERNTLYSKAYKNINPDISNNFSIKKFKLFIKSMLYKTINGEYGITSINDLDNMSSKLIFASDTPDADGMLYQIETQIKYSKIKSKWEYSVTKLTFLQDPSLGNIAALVDVSVTISNKFCKYRQGLDKLSDDILCWFSLLDMHPSKQKNKFFDNKFEYSNIFGRNPNDIYSRYHVFPIG